MGEDARGRLRPDIRRRRPGQYDGTLAVSVSALIVTIAQFAQSIYAMRR